MTIDSRGLIDAGRALIRRGPKRADLQSAAGFHRDLECVVDIPWLGVGGLSKFTPNLCL
jgi:hypothetical protein